MSADTIRAIPTTYAGVSFRSRLEARWATFFDALGIRWEYEAEGYEYESWRYLPDFWLPDLGYWCEVKGDVASVTDDYLNMLGHVGHFLPGVHNSAGSRGVILLGGIPSQAHTEATGSGVPIHTMVSHYKGCATYALSFTIKGVSPAARTSWDFGDFVASEFDEWLLSSIDPSDLWNHRYWKWRDVEVMRSCRAAFRGYDKARAARWTR